MKTFMLLLFAPFYYWHTIYVSVIEIKRADFASNVEITIKIFTDDLEEAIRADFGEAVSCRTPEQLNQHRSLIVQYIADHFKLSINGQPKEYEYMALTNEDQATFINMLTVAQGDIGQIYIETDMLLSLFPTQENIVSLDINGQKSFMRLNKGKKSAEIRY